MAKAFAPAVHTGLTLHFRDSHPPDRHGSNSIRIPTSMTFRPVLALCILTALTTAAAAQERQWSLDASDQDAYLVFGVPDTEDVGLSLWCPIRQGTVNLFVPEQADAVGKQKTATMEVTAGSLTERFTGSVEVNAEAGIASVEAKLDVADKLFGAMATADRLKVRIGKNETVYPLYDADVPGLLDLCRKA